MVDHWPVDIRMGVGHRRLADLGFRNRDRHGPSEALQLPGVDIDCPREDRTFAAVILEHLVVLVGSCLAAVHLEVPVEDQRSDMEIPVEAPNRKWSEAFHRDDRIAERWEDSLGPDSVVRTEDILVDLDRVGSVEDNPGSVHVADRDLAAGDILEPAAASGLAAEGHLIFPVDREREDPDWKQSARQRMSVAEPGDLRDNYPPVADSAVADEPG